MIGHVIVAVAAAQAFPLGVPCEPRRRNCDQVRAYIIESAEKCSVNVEIRARARTENGVTIDDLAVFVVSVPANATEEQRDCLANALKTIPEGPGPQLQSLNNNAQTH